MCLLVVRILQDVSLWNLRWRASRKIIVYYWKNKTIKSLMKNSQHWQSSVLLASLYPLLTTGSLHWDLQKDATLWHYLLPVLTLQLFVRLMFSYSPFLFFFFGEAPWMAYRKIPTFSFLLFPSFPFLLTCLLRSTTSIWKASKKRNTSEPRSWKPKLAWKKSLQLIDKSRLFLRCWKTLN